MSSFLMHHGPVGSDYIFIQTVFLLDLSAQTQLLLASHPAWSFPEPLQKNVDGLFSFLHIHLISPSF